MRPPVYAKPCGLIPAIPGASVVSTSRFRACSKMAETSRWATSLRRHARRSKPEIVRLLDQGICPIALGGDHSVTYPIVRAYRGRVNGLTIVHVDAHTDLYDEFQGDRYSHACPFARIMEEGLAERLVQIGIRTASSHQRQQAAKFGAEIYDMSRWSEAPLETIQAPVYVSIDLDGIDPAFAPGVSHPEPGGLSTRDVVSLVHRLPARIVGADLVEYNPDHDVRDLTARVAAKLVKELVGSGIVG